MPASKYPVTAGSPSGFTTRDINNPAKIANESENRSLNSSTTTQPFKMIYITKFLPTQHYTPFFGFCQEVYRKTLHNLFRPFPHFFDKYLPSPKNGRAPKKMWGRGSVYRFIQISTAWYSDLRFHRSPRCLDSRDPKWKERPRV